jgi:hypothetical protein
VLIPGLAALALLVALVSPLFEREAVASPPGFRTTITPAAMQPPIRRLEGDDKDVSDLLEKLLRQLSDAKNTVGNSNDPPTGADALSLAHDLDSAELKIEQLFDPYVLPVLDPVDAGAIDPAVTPLTLVEHACACADLAEEAYVLSLFGQEDHEEIGSALKTIRHLLPGYRELAGL